MPILRCEDAIRLTGIDAENFLRDTGRNTLPKSVAEYNLAMKQVRELWNQIDTPESRLIAATCFEDL